MNYRLLSRTLVLKTSLGLLVACGSSTKSDAGGTGGGSTAGSSATNGGSSTTSGGTSATSGGMSTTSMGGVSTGNGGAPGAGGGSSANGGATAGGASASGGSGTAGATATGGSGGGSTGKGGSAGTGTGGSGGAAAGAPAGGAAAQTVSVLERNNHPSRDGHFVQSALTKAAAGKMATDAGFAGKFTGNMWASPLYLADGPGGKGEYFAVTTGNDVFALDATTGATIWTKNLGSSPTANGVNCGNIHPLGILSTPVIDATARTIFVVGAIGTTSILRHELHAFNVDDGTERSGFPVDLSKIAAGSLTMTPPPYNQRSALSLVNGIVYVPFGGHIGDCGSYHGWVTAIDSKSPTNAGAWASLGVGEGIWAPGGLASDGSGVFALTGNNTQSASSRTNSDGEQAMRLTGLAKFDRTNANMYYPSTWRTMDSQDADFGATSPIYLKVAGSTPSTILVAITKDGHFHLLDSTNLGGADGMTSLVDLSVSSGAMSIHTVPAAYTTSQGVHVVLSTDSGAMCPSGGASGKVVMSVLLTAGAPPTAKVAWCAALGGTVTAPIATTTDGTTDALVWYMSNGKLTAVDGDTGASVYTSSDTCSGVRQWTSPIAASGHIVVGGDTHLCSWSPH